MKRSNNSSNKESNPFLGELSAVKVEAISSIILTVGYAISTLASIMAVEEAEQTQKTESAKSIDHSKELKQLNKQLQNLNCRLDSIERKLNHYQ